MINLCQSHCLMFGSPIFLIFDGESILDTQCKVLELPSEAVERPAVALDGWLFGQGFGNEVIKHDKTCGIIHYKGTLISSQMYVCTYIYIHRYIHMYTCIYNIHMYTCMHKYIYTYLHKLTYLDIYIYTHVHIYRCNMYVCMYVCMYAWMYACMHAWMDGWMHPDGWMDACMHACMDVCMYVGMYVCMHAWMDGCVCMYVCR